MGGVDVPRSPTTGIWSGLVVVTLPRYRMTITRRRVTERRDDTRHQSGKGGQSGIHVTDSGSSQS
jgi:hypothetical protein